MSIRNVPRAHPQSHMFYRSMHILNYGDYSTRTYVSSERDMGEEAGSSFHQQRLKTTAKKNEGNTPSIGQDVCVRYGVVDFLDYMIGIHRNENVMPITTMQYCGD